MKKLSDIPFCIQAVGVCPIRSFSSSSLFFLLLPLAVLGLKELEVGVPLVADHLSSSLFLLDGIEVRGERWKESFFSCRRRRRRPQWNPSVLSLSLSQARLDGRARAAAATLDGAHAPSRR